jgi:Terminase small subunit
MLPTKKEIEFKIWNDPDLMLKIANHVVSGGSVIDLADTLNLRYCDIMQYIRSDKTRSEIYDKALQDRTEWARERVLQEMQRIATIDMREAYGPNGELKPVSEWPPGLAAAVSAIETHEETDSEGNGIGTTKRVKFWDKTKSLEMLAKNLKLLTDKVEHTGSLTLEQLVAKSYEIKPKD